MPAAKYIVVLSVVFSLAITLVHLYIFYSYGINTVRDHLIGILIGSVNEFTVGLLVTSALFFSAKNRLLNISVFLFLFLVIALKIICYHYEAVFGHLPGASILYYLSELQNINVSLKVNLPPLNVFLEVVTVFGIYLIASKTLALPRYRISGNHGWIFIGLAGFACSLMIQAMPASVPDRYFMQSREALTWLIKSNFINRSYNVKGIRITERDIDRFLYLHGHTNYGPAISDEYPLCRIRPSVTSDGETGRSVIILALESVSYDVMRGTYQGKELMPVLAGIADENLSFRNIYSSGVRSSQALSSMFSGLPAHPFTMYLWTSPLLNLDGFPRILSQENYQTVYMHGADLAFEHQRQYLTETGFNQLVEYELDKQRNSLSWGYHDEFMFNKLKEWIENSGTNQPYLAILATLSTHDPYVLPADWQPVFSESVRQILDTAVCCKITGEKDPGTALAETYRYLDKQIEDFYDWYGKNAADAILLITADHAPQLDFLGKKEKSYKHDFHIPLIIAGLDDEEKKQYEKYIDRVGGQLDIPSTIMYLLGMQSHECDLGLNLLADGQYWPEERVLYAAGGDSFEHLQIWYKGMDATYDRIRDEIHINNIDNKGISNEKELLGIVNTIFFTHLYLTNNDAYGFSTNKHADIEELPSVVTPIVISHRGNINGPSDSKYENSLDAIENAAAGEFDWIEVDVQLTKDGVPVLFHDDYIVNNGKKVAIADISYADMQSLFQRIKIVKLEDFVNSYSNRLNMLIEIKHVSDIYSFTRLTREVPGIINNRPVKNRIIIDSFNEFIPFSIRNYCDCETGYDLPYKKVPVDADLRHAARMNFDWIYLHYDVIDESLIKAAHEYGLKVMAYTVNDMEIVEQWAKTELPDGIITDSIAINNYFKTGR